MRPTQLAQLVGQRRMRLQQQHQAASPAEGLAAAGEATAVAAATAMLACRAMPTALACTLNAWRTGVQRERISLPMA